MQLLSTGSQYVLTALILIGRRPEGETISATELASMLNSPTAYLSQMLAKLQEPGIIGSKRGANGGVFISKSLSQIRLIDIIIALEGDSFFRRCFLGIDGCGHIEPCPFHDQWTAQRMEIRQWLTGTTLYDLCNDVNDSWISERLHFSRPEVS
ncbi:MAG: Rrf2 family transcriptional regulator [Bacteroidetes bacterium]|nr:Rrf2 family transcriptional regulator [Bacteroidota bacterium]MCH8523306.1 Rrf2 family transcriptional regulator [Balneolales bacterium]